MGNNRDNQGNLVFHDDACKSVTLRQIGWVVNGGPNNGLFVPLDQQVPRDEPIGGFSPVYVEVRESLFFMTT